MARITSLDRRRLRRRGDGADRLSALPDDLLRLILRRLDTRTALSTAVLATRWAHLPRDLPALGIRVSDVLPRRYHRSLALRRLASRSQAGVVDLDVLIARCERRATHAFVEGVTALLEADIGGARRRAKCLSLEFFPPKHEQEFDSSGVVVDRMISRAVDAWGVEDLEVVVKPLYARCNLGGEEEAAASYTFPHYCLEADCRSRMRSLTLGNCPPPPALHMYGALTQLVLRDLPETTEMAAYQSVFAACSALQSLCLESCGCTEEQLVIDAPSSRIEQLVVDGCSFLTIELRALPMLERLACMISTVELRYGGGPSSVPRLTHVTLAFSSGQSVPRHHELGCFLEDAPATVSSLVVELTGPKRWIVPRCLDTRLYGLTKLLVAEIPSFWDVSWPRLLLVAAPSLEVLHITVKHHQSEKEKQPAGREICWQPSRFWHRRLREVAMAGFDRRWRQIYYLRYLVRVCKSLERVLLVKDLCKGLWDWEVVKHHGDCPWSERDKMAVRTQITCGRSWSKPHLRVLVQ